MSRPVRQANHLMLAGLLGSLLTFAPQALAQTLVVANKSEATVSLVDLKSAEVKATLPTGEGPHEVAISSDGGRAVITNYGIRGKPGSTLTVLDIPRAKVLATLDLGKYTRPHGVVWTAGDRELVVTAEDHKALLRVEVETGRILAAIPTGQEVSHMVALTPDGTRAFVANIGSGSVTAVDLARGKALASVPTGEGAEGVDVSPDGKFVWVTNRAADTVSVLDAGSLEIVGTLPSKAFPIRAKILPDGSFLLVSNARSGDLAVIDTKARKVARRVPLELDAKDAKDRLFGNRFGDSSVPIGIVVEPGGKRAYVAHAYADAISIVDLGSWKKVGSLTAGREPDGMGYSALSVKGPAPSAEGARR